jgi:hypothetical protein
MDTAISNRIVDEAMESLTDTRYRALLESVMEFSDLVQVVSPLYCPFCPHLKQVRRRFSSSRVTFFHSAFDSRGETFDIGFRADAVGDIYGLEGARTPYFEPK